MTSCGPYSFYDSLISIVTRVKASNFVVSTVTADGHVQDIGHVQRQQWSYVTWLGCKLWWRHRMETFSALLAPCEDNTPVTGEFPSQRPVTRNFDAFFDLRLKKKTVDKTIEQGAALQNHFGPFGLCYRSNFLMNQSLLLTHWGRDKIAVIFQTTFSNAFHEWNYVHFDWYFTELCS